MRTLVIGLRATGAVVAAWCRERGDDVTVTEERPGQPEYAARKAECEALGIRVVEGQPDWSALVADADLVVPSPGVRPDHPVMAAAVAHGVLIRGDLDLAVEAALVPVVVVTGTNGKSTVTTLISAMLEASGERAPAVGNIGRVALEVVHDDVDVLVIEASSFQLHTVTPTFAPAVAVILNLADDHLDWHGSFSAYAAAKAHAFRFQGPTDAVVWNQDDAAVAELISPARGVRIAFTGADPAPGTVGWRGDALMSADGRVVGTWEEREFAPHERANIAAAAAAAALVGATESGIASAVTGFQRLHHRTELVGQAGGVEYVDDSKATNPHAAVAAVLGYPSVVLLAGGESKGVDLGALRAVADRLRHVIAIGDTPEEIEQVFAGTTKVTRAASMCDAVRSASAAAQPGDVVLLSPACASFDWYSSYAERGDDFRAEVEALIGTAEAIG